jgi:hypothetical protein
MQFLAGLETHGFSGGNADFSAGTGVAANSGFACADTEDAKSAQFDALSGRKSLFEALEDGINGGFRLGARQAGALDHVMDDVLLNQWGNLATTLGTSEFRPTEVIVQVLHRLWNSELGKLWKGRHFSFEEKPGS